MKQKLLFLVVISSLIFTSCKKDEEDSLNQPNTAVQAKIDSRLVGKWKHSSYSFEPFFGQIFNTYNLELKSNGNYHLVIDQHNNDYSYTYDSERIGNSSTRIVDQVLIDEWDAAFEDEEVTIDFKITTKVNDKTYVEYMDLYDDDNKMRYLWQSEDEKKFRVYTKL